MANALVFFFYLHFYLKVIRETFAARQHKGAVRTLLSFKRLVQALEFGQCATLRIITDVDRGPSDPKSLLVVSLITEDELHIVGCQEGVLEQKIQQLNYVLYIRCWCKKMFLIFVLVWQPCQVRLLENKDLQNVRAGHIARLDDAATTRKRWRFSVTLAVTQVDRAKIKASQCNSVSFN